MLRFSQLRRAGRVGAVDGQRADRQQVALAGDHPAEHVLHERGRVLRAPAGAAGDVDGACQAADVRRAQRRYLFILAIG